MKINQSETEMLKNLFEGLIHISRLLEFEFQKINQSPDFNQKDIAEVIKQLHENCTGEVILYSDFIFQLLDSQERGDSMEFEQTIKNFMELANNSKEDAA
ncbi:MAG TPA: hypothetical protein PLT92_00285 [Ignavibacteriaceae bacterium]|nr:hypothetical protein [Ignavibacteriaceae bacterium]